MRFRLGPIPEDERFDPVAEGWTPLKEPSAGTLLSVAVPTGMIMAALVAWMWSLIWPVSDFGLGAEGFSLTVTLPGLLGGTLLVMAFVWLHELLHAVPLMLTGSWDDIVFGFWPRRLVPYVATLGAAPRNVQLTSGVLPLVVMTLAPLLVAAVLSLYSPWLLLLSASNAAASGADLIALMLYVRQIPASAAVRNQGYSTWWKDPTSGGKR